MANQQTPPFIMHGAHNAIACGLVHIEEQVQGIERAVAEKPGLAFDLAKTLVESVCRAVLDERGIPYSEEDGLPALFKNVSKNLPFLPPAASGEYEVRKSLAQTLGGLHTAIQGICELRNQCGYASHGSGAPRPTMESAQALLAAEAADAIIGFLHRCHQQGRVLPLSARAIFEQNSAFNDYVDETYGVIRIFDVEFPSSEILFKMEPETYRVYQTEFALEPKEAGEEVEDGGTPKAET